MRRKWYKTIEEAVGKNRAWWIWPAMTLVSLLILGACQPRIAIIERDVTRVVRETVVVGTPQTIEKEVTRIVLQTTDTGTPQVVEKEVTRIVEKVVTATPEPTISQSTLDNIREACRAQTERGRRNQAQIPEGHKVSPYKDLIYVQDQVILSGQVESIQESIETLGLALQLVDGFVLLGKNLTAVQLYRITDGTYVEQVTCEINALREWGPRFSASADPNYHMSPAGWAGGGSPWTQNGEWSTDGGGMGDASEERFLTQWAFGPMGIGLFDSNGNRTVTKYEGRGVRIGVFDTSPFVKDIGEVAECAQCFNFRDLMGNVEDEITQGTTLSLTVRHPPLTPVLTCPGLDRITGKSREDQDISNHGIFVASLIHSVAPASEIYLVRVLEDDGCGDLFTISQSIETFMQETLNEGGVDKIVINLSLGVHQPEKPTSFGLPEEVVSLQHTISETLQRGAIVVAAAGNDSYASESPLDMEIPASEPGVIGVAASNSSRERGCFSNAAMSSPPDTMNLSAPGGDGVLSETTGPCTVPKCRQNDDDLCLVGLAYTPTLRYIYWVGTSFAAPLVSGQEALRLEAGSTGSVPASTKTCSSPDTALDPGIINLPKSLLSASSCPP
jgi:hypothetical protein